MLGTYEALRLSTLRSPDSVAIDCGSRRLSYAAFIEMVDRFGNGLLRLGAVQGDRVALLLGNCAETLAAYYALERNGLVAVPMNTRLAPSEVSYILNHSGARVLVVEEAFLDTVIAVVDNGDTEITDERIVVLGAAERQMASWDAITAHSTAEPVRVPQSPTDLEAIFYTSGTTGFPKGVMRDRAGEDWGRWTIGFEFGFTPDDINYCVGPLFHQSYLVIAQTHLALGGTVVIERSWEPERALATIARTRATTAFLVPTMSKDLIDLGPRIRSTYDVAQFRTLVSSGSSLPTSTKDALFDAFPSIELHEGYGWTEVMWVTNLRPRDQRRKLRCVGKPTLGSRVAVLDEAGAPATPGTPGEIFARMGVDFPGYFRDPERSSAVRRGDLVTGGDIGQFDDEGYLYVLDRKNDMLICGGENIYPLEIEELISTHPDVREVGVVGVDDDRLGEVPKAFVVLEPGRTVSASDILEFCDGRLAKYKWPRSVEFMDTLPRTALGKLLRRSLRDGSQPHV